MLDNKYTDGLVDLLLQTVYYLNTCLAHAVANSVTANVTTEAAFRPPLFYGLLTFSLLQLLAWLLPNHYFPWVTFYQEFLSAAALLFLFTIWATTSASLKVPYFSIFITAVAVIPLLQYWSGIIPFTGDAVIASLYVLGLAMAITQGFNLNHQQYNIFYILSLIFIIGGLISTFISLYQWQNLTGLGIYIADLPPHARPFANLAQPNNLATLLVCALIAITYLWETRNISSLVAGITTVTLLIGITLTQSRTVWAMTIVLCLWWLLKKGPLKLRLSGRIIVTIITTYTILIMLIPHIEGTLLLSDHTREISTKLGLRKVIWLQLSDAIWNGPFWGYGWNQTSAAQITTALEHPTSVVVQQSHNIILELLVWNGPWLGIFLVGCVLWWVLTRAYNVASKDDWFAVSMILAISVHAMLEFPLHYAFFLFPFGLLVGFIEANYSNGNRLSLLAPRPGLIIIALLGIILLTLITREYLIIEKDFRLLRFETASIGKLRADQPAPDVLLLTQQREFTRFARTEASENMSVEDIEHMKTVAHRFAYPSSLFRYSLALGLNKKFEEASIELQRLRKLHGEEQYQEAKDNWVILSEKHPELRAVIIP